MSPDLTDRKGYVQTWHDRPFARQQYLNPKDTPAEIIVDRERISRGPGFSREHRIVEIDDLPRRRRDSSPRQPRSPSRSANPQRREVVVANKGILGSTVAIRALLTPPGRHRRNSSDFDSEVDSDTDSSSPHRIRSRRHYNKDLPVVRAGPVLVNPPDRSRSMGPLRSRSHGPHGPRRRYDSDSDSDSSSDDGGGKKAQPKPPPKQLLYTGLACVATIAAANNIYQSAKAHHTRQKELEEGEISGAEAQKQKMQARKMDLISLGVAAVGAYNVRNGWKRAEGHVSTPFKLLLHVSHPFSSTKTCLRSKKRAPAPQRCLQIHESVFKGRCLL